MKDDECRYHSHFTVLFVSIVCTKEERKYIGNENFSQSLNQLSLRARAVPGIIIWVGPLYKVLNFGEMWMFNFQE